MPNKQNITLNIDVHKVSLEVPRDDEEVYRKAAVLINRKFRDYRQVVRKETSAERAWVYVALHMAVELMSDERDKNLEPVMRKIEELNRIIETAASDKAEQPSAGPQPSTK